jgi:hypothetical protein
MKSTKDPMSSDAGCFAGLISIVAENIPALKAAYKGNSYDCFDWQYALNGNASSASTNVLKLFVFIVSPFVVSQTL